MEGLLLSALCIGKSYFNLWINKVYLFLLLLGYHPQSNRTHKPEPGECAQVQLVTQQPGAPTCRGSSTRTTPWCPPRPACPRSWLCLANSSPCLSTRRRKLWCCLSGRSSVGAEPFGGRYMQLSPRQANHQRTPPPVYHPRQKVWLERETSHSRWSQDSCPRGSVQGGNSTN